MIVANKQKKYLNLHFTECFFSPAFSTSKTLKAKRVNKDVVNIPALIHTINGDFKPKGQYDHERKKKQYVLLWEGRECFICFDSLPIFRQSLSFQSITFVFALVVLEGIGCFMFKSIKN